jgi:hypothetical protein
MGVLSRRDAETQRKTQRFESGTNARKEERTQREQRHRGAGATRRYGYEKK